MIEYWHNPRCSKSRTGLEMLRERGVEVRERLYLKDAPDLDEILGLWRALGQPPVKEMMRKGQKEFAALGLSKKSDDATLLQAMVAEPILIERPIAVAGDKAIIGRPPERILDLL